MSKTHLGNRARTSRDSDQVGQSSCTEASRTWMLTVYTEGQVDAVNQVRTEEARKEQAEAKKRDPTLAVSNPLLGDLQIHSLTFEMQASLHGN